jgi:hypothetical protein
MAQPETPESVAAVATAREDISRHASDVKHWKGYLPPGVEVAFEDGTGGVEPDRRLPRESDDGRDG